MTAAAGIGMLACVAVAMAVTGLPVWIVLIGTTMAFAVSGAAAGVVPWALLSAVPARVVGLLENDLLQALPLYVLLGAMLDRLPLAEALFRTGRHALRFTGAPAPLAGLSLAALLAPMNGSVGASALMLGRTVRPRLAAGGMPAAPAAALVCAASTLGVVIPPSLVLILFGDAMMRAHTEAVRVSGQAVRIVNTQDVFAGALVPAAVLFVLTMLAAWRIGRRTWDPAARHEAAPRVGEWLVGVTTAALVAGLLVAVTLGYLYAVEAAAAGGVALFAFGVATGSMTRRVLREVLHDTLHVTGALFALLLAATVFTIVVRAFGTDRWFAEVLVAMPGGAGGTLAAVLAVVALCALVLDAFEMIFVVVPVVMPPLLVAVPDATWVSVLTLLVLQSSFLTPPFGYAVLMARHGSGAPLPMRALARALAPYLFVQWLVFALVVAFPQLVWQRTPTELPASAADAPDADAGRDALAEQLRLNAEPPPEPDDAAPAAPR